MIAYLMLGTNDLDKAASFYDSLLNEMGATIAYKTDRLVSWSFGERTSLFTITRPYNANRATVGNGVMVGLRVENPEVVNMLHAKALTLGGTNEGDPGLRGKNFYVGYFRDLDGNKINFHCYT